MPHISVLRKEISELIAAGEVIERPSSVIKEVVENAIDAGAKHITVEIQHGGTTYMRIVDDGCGMAAEEVPTAFIRHATSKNSDKADLDHIFTLGFRGEALASIAAVAKVTVLTKRKEDDYGTSYSISGGVAEKSEQTGCPDGTTLLIRDLFYNVPVRQKFMKRDVTEANAVSQIVQKIALSHPEIAFRMIRDNRTEFRTDGSGDLYTAVYAILGKEFAHDLIPVSYQDGMNQVTGFVGKPLYSRSNRTFQNFFINGRYVRSRQCSVALENAYQNLIMVGKFPTCVLMLQVPPEQVDVNIHPAKAEVRFSNEKAVMDSLEKEGRVHVTQKGKYIKGEAKQLRGMFQANARGFGFVTVEGESEDIFISEDDMNGAMQGDEVEVVITKAPEGKRREGKITKIVQRGIQRIVGYYQSRKNFGFVVPDNERFLQDIFVPAERSKGAVTGHKVVVELTSYGENGKKPEGKIVEILGHVTDPGVDILSIVKGYDLPTEFPEKVLNQAERVAKAVTTADMAGRKDVRSWQTVTIDGEDAKDLDDAITLTKEGDRYILGVHIADVTNYVQENSALDREALKRGTSVYLADRVIPMLPRVLSNGMCSLNAGEDRLALSCIMTIDAKGNVIDHQIAETVVNVDERMSYTSVKKILEDRDEAECERYHDLIPMFELMKELSHILRERRHRRGAIDFDFPEAKIILNESGEPVDIKAYDRNVATKIIEDFMLVANETVAEDYFWQEIPFLYRVHETPDDDKMKKLVTFLQNFGYTMHMQGGQEIRPKEVQKLLDKIEGTPEEAMISRLALRSMKQARYSPDNDGHFGLATQYYTHFTSPIRRYPDLQIHRIIKDNLRGRMNDAKRHHYEKILPEVAMETSSLERRADEAERETLKLKKVQYMRNFFGQEFEGVISGITKWGIYVELPNTVEGLVHVTNMTDDHYDYDEEHYQMIGSHHRKTYKLGQKVRVKMIDCDEISRTIDFRLVKERKEEREDG